MAVVDEAHLAEGQVNIIQSSSTDSSNIMFAFLVTLLRLTQDCDGGSPLSINHMYKVVQIWPGLTVTCLHTDRPGHIWTTLYYWNIFYSI
jgi:hypothetical protein